MSDFKTAIVHDPCIGDITSDLTYQVRTGASATTYQPFPSTSSANSNITFNIHCPRENIVVGRDVLIQSGISFRVNITNVPLDDSAVEWGQTASLQAFPLAQLMTTASVSINNTTTSENVQETLPQLMRMNNSRELYRYNSMTPSLPDQSWGEYANAVDSNSNPMASYNNTSYDVDQQPRGAFPCYVQLDHYIAGVYTDDSAISTGLTDTWTLTVFTVVTEPIFVSPFTWGNPEFNAQGMLGINAFNLQLNIDTTLNRLFSITTSGDVTQVAGRVIDPQTPSKWSANPNLFQTPSIAGSLVPSSSSPTMLLKFLSTQPSDVIETRNVVPYMNCPRYITSQSNGLSIASKATQDFNSSNLQISQLPDYFIVVVRKQFSTLTPKDANAFLTINSMSINLNNQSGLLSSMSQADAFRMSQKNGYNGSFLEFTGQAFYNIPTSVGGCVPTTGSIMVISPADLSLPDYLAPGSIGNFNYQFRVNVTNQFSQAVQAEICVICVNSGIMSIQQGTANIFQGILTKQMVLDACHTKENVMSTMTSERMIGGKMGKIGQKYIPSKSFTREVEFPFH